MAIGISGDSAVVPQTATSENLSGSAVPVSALVLQDPAGLFDIAVSDGAQRLQLGQDDMLRLILVQLQVITMILAEGLNTQTDIEGLRSDLANDSPLN